MDNLDYYILADKARKTAYDIGDLIGELPYRKKHDTIDFAIVNIRTHMEGLAELIKQLEKK